MGKRLSRENIVMQVWGSIIMGIVLSIAMPLIARGTVDVYSFVSGFILSFWVTLVLKLLTPVIEAAQKLTAKLGCRPGTVQHRLVSSIFLAIIMGTTMSLLMTWWGIRGTQGYTALFFKSWLRSYPWVLIIVYVMINVSILTGSWIVGRYCSGEHRKVNEKDNIVPGKACDR